MRLTYFERVKAGAVSGAFVDVGAGGDEDLTAVARLRDGGVGIAEGEGPGSSGLLGQIRASVGVDLNDASACGA